LWIFPTPWTLFFVAQTPFFVAQDAVPAQEQLHKSRFDLQDIILA
jgi:hypothetical protein